MVIRTQKRGQLTRTAVVHRAAEEFDRHGYIHATLQDIVDAVGVTKGGLYFHFTSKEHLARAVIDAGFTRLDQIFAERMNTQTSAAEALIEFTYALAADHHSDPTIAAAFRLVLEIGDYRGTAPTTVFDRWTQTCRELVRRAGAEGDFREDIDSDELARFLVEAAYSVRLHAGSPGPEASPAQQIPVMWRLLLPGLTDPATGQYLCQFAARRTRPTDTAAAVPHRRRRLPA
ncbi:MULTISPECIES: ScbR family autoregulator-binding transcription factor [unclassified Rhodococcus (in: high G+C Gram-positive bacteria)]|uniref:ScbR family autoregulator-binding transcription factor n=1 Tax=unclassified Rhodococcus (in: high G+C Gram-positive bacteria) TaxID=192944 RepID=UPI00163A11E8|nr:MULTISPECIES: ScbR family autoregulator-binding transcription factor [unclassified Rhodococcus (in: high G+C Gram-positive bacteria)]MBC2644546.1 TetR/AcrR family transcriptional regulator [Rhodococcus sp. 3A]MBC2897765.1 TetR/AcrR family transcriptional regulator [Rhodococcus sp. 4CII]